MKYSENEIKEILHSYQKRAKRLEENISDLGAHSTSSLVPSDASEDISYNDSRIKIDNFDIKYFRSYLIDFRIFMNYKDEINPNKNKMFFESVLDIMKDKYPDDNSLKKIDEDWNDLQNNYSKSIIEIKSLSKEDFIYLFLQSVFHEDKEKLKTLKDIDIESAFYRQLFMMEIKDMIAMCILPLSKFIDKINQSIKSL